MTTDETLTGLREMATYDCGFEEQSDIALAAADVIVTLLVEVTSLRAKLDAAVARNREIEESLLDMTVQFSSYNDEMRHTFMSSEESAYDVLEITYGEKVVDVYTRFEKKWRGAERSE